MTAIAVELQNTNTSVFLAQETNTAWKPQTMVAIQTQCHCVQGLAMSLSQDSSESQFQPGGTLSLALGK